MCFHFNSFEANDILTCNIENIPTYPLSVAVVGFVMVVVVVLAVVVVVMGTVVGMVVVGMAVVVWWW